MFTVGSKSNTALLPTAGIFMICSIFSQLLFLPHLFLLSVKQVPQVNYYCQDKSYHAEASQKGQVAQISVRNPDQALCQAAFGLGKQLKPGLHHTTFLVGITIVIPPVQISSECALDWQKRGIEKKEQVLLAHHQQRFLLNL